MRHIFYSLLLAALILTGGSSLSMAQVAAIKTGTEALLQGQTRLLLAPTGAELGIVPAGFFATETARYTQLFAFHNQQIAIAQKELFRPLKKGFTPAPNIITVGSALLPGIIHQNNVVAKRYVALQRAKHNKESLLYEWGLLQDQANALGFKSAPTLQKESNGTVLLQFNDRSVLIQISPSSAEGNELTSVDTTELKENALSLYTTERAISLDALEASLQDNPQQVAAFFYLRQNFHAAWTEFLATSQAYQKYMLANTSAYQQAKNWLVGESETGKQIKQNYLHASANLALHMSKLLSFMASHSTQAFEQSLKTYKELMRVKNTHQQVPTTFQNFWTPIHSI